MEFIKEPNLKTMECMMSGISRDYKATYIGKNNPVEQCTKWINNQMILKLLKLLALK